MCYSEYIFLILYSSRSLAIELCQIIHRTGLTQESIEALLLAADVLRLVIDGAREQLHANMQAKIKGIIKHFFKLINMLAQLIEFYWITKQPR